jgi:hypothetical protein
MAHGKWPSSGSGRRREDLSRQETLKRRVKAAAHVILDENATDLSELFEQSPTALRDGPESDWLLLLELFDPEDIVWIGDVRQSGPGHASHFRPVSAWRKMANAPGQFICPNTFRPGSYSRCNENIHQMKFLVVESDILSKSQTVAVFSWCRNFLNLRAIVDTAGKSVHGWFDFPRNPTVLDDLKIILPELHCDPALFRPSNPCRLPGARRGDKFQSLLWIDLIRGGKDAQE